MLIEALGITPLGKPFWRIGQGPLPCGCHGRRRPMLSALQLAGPFGPGLIPGLLAGETPIELHRFFELTGSPRGECRQDQCVDMPGLIGEDLRAKRDRFTVAMLCDRSFRQGELFGQRVIPLSLLGFLPPGLPSRPFRGAHPLELAFKHGESLCRPSTLCDGRLIFFQAPVQADQEVPGLAALGVDLPSLLGPGQRLSALTMRAHSPGSERPDNARPVQSPGAGFHSHRGWSHTLAPRSARDRGARRAAGASSRGGPAHRARPARETARSWARRLTWSWFLSRKHNAQGPGPQGPGSCCRRMAVRCSSSSSRSRSPKCRSASSRRWLVSVRGSMVFKYAWNCGSRRGDFIR